MRKVHFEYTPEVHCLPQNEARDAWLARHGPWVCAPKHDELWDGTLQQFRPHELTSDELRRLRQEDKLRKALPLSVFWAYKRYRKRIPEEIHPGIAKLPLAFRQDIGEVSIRELGGQGADSSSGKSDVEAEVVVPPEFIQAVLQNSIRECLSAGIKPALKKPIQLRESLRRSLGRLDFKSRGDKSLPSRNRAMTLEEDEDDGGAEDEQVEEDDGNIRNSLPREGVQVQDSENGGLEMRSSGFTADLQELAFSAMRRVPTLIEYLSPSPSKEGEDDNLDEAIPWLESIQRLDGLNNSSVPRSEAVTEVWEMLETAFDRLCLLSNPTAWDLDSLLQTVFPSHQEPDDFKSLNQPANDDEPCN